MRPHSSLGWKTPAAYAAGLEGLRQPDSHDEWTDEWVRSLRRLSTIAAEWLRIVRGTRRVLSTTATAPGLVRR